MHPISITFIIPLTCFFYSLGNSYYYSGNPNGPKLFGYVMVQFSNGIGLVRFVLKEKIFIQAYIK